MEDLLIIILQVLGQIIFELFAYLPWDWIWYAVPFDWEEDDSWRKWLAAIFSLIIGILLGWASLHFFPDVMVKWGWLRIAFLVISPLGSGMIAREVAQWRKERNSSVDPMFHFWIGLCFSVGLVWVRFAFAHRPG